MTFSTSPLKPLKETWQEAGSQRPLPSLCFGPIRKTRWLPWQIRHKIGTLYSDVRYVAFWAPSQCNWAEGSSELLWSCVVRPFVVNFSHARLLIWNCWTEFNETWQEAGSQRPLPSLCFSGRSEKQDDNSGFWLAKTFLTSPLKPLRRIQLNLKGSKIPKSSVISEFFSGRLEKENDRPDPWFAETFSNSPLKPLKAIQRNLTGSKI